MNTIAIKNDYYFAKEFSYFQKFTKLEIFSLALSNLQKLMQQHL